MAPIRQGYVPRWSVPFIVTCPACANPIKLPDTAVRATCPKCMQFIQAVRPDEESQPGEGSDSAGLQSSSVQTAARTAPMKSVPPTGAEEWEEGGEESSLPGWISPWGVAASRSRTGLVHRNPRWAFAG